MTYSETVSLLSYASKFDNFVDFLSECGPSFISYNLDTFTAALYIIYSMREAVTATAILEAFHLSIAELSRKYSIPYRTVQNWCSTGSEHREAPPYVLRLILTDLLCDLIF